MGSWCIVLVGYYRIRRQAMEKDELLGIIEQAAEEGWTKLDLKR